MGIGTIACLVSLGLVGGQWAAGSRQQITGVTPAAAHRLPSDAGQVRLGEKRMDQEKEKAAAVARAKAHLARTLKVEPERLTLESATAATWPDAALGCPEKDRMYAQVVTEGYKVILRADGKKHEVHVAGSRAVLCEPAKK